MCARSSRSLRNDCDKKPAKCTKREWQVHELGDLEDYASYADKPGIGDVAVCADSSAANNDAVRAVMKIKRSGYFSNRAIWPSR